MILSFIGNLKDTGAPSGFFWRDGEYTGGAYVDFEIAAARLGGQAIGPMPSPWSTTMDGHLQDPRSVNVLASYVFEEGFSRLEHPPLEEYEPPPQS